MAAVLPYVHCAFFSCEKKTPEIREFLIKARSYGPEYVVATFGEEGACVMTVSGSASKGISGSSCEHSGSGDSFIAGFTWGLMVGRDIEGCLKEGGIYLHKLYRDSIHINRKCPSLH